MIYFERRETAEAAAQQQQQQQLSIGWTTVTWIYNGSCLCVYCTASSVHETFSLLNKPMVVVHGTTNNAARSGANKMAIIYNLKLEREMMMMKRRQTATANKRIMCFMASSDYSTLNLKLDQKSDETTTTTTTTEP